MKLIIHAGMPKNGSSSVQASLQASCDQLMKQGVLIFDTVNTLPMPRALTDASSYLPPSKAFAARYDGQEVLDALVRENWEAYERLKQKEADFLIVSSEIFPQLHDHADFWDRLTDGFQSVDFLVYLRNPVKFYSSLINQMIQGGNNLHTTFKKHFKMNSLDNVFNVRDLCHSRNFPIRLRSFERKDLAEGDVVEDFSVQLSSLCRRNINLKKTLPRNESFSHEALFALYVFNNAKGADSTRMDWNIRKSLSEQLRQLDSNAGKTMNFSNPPRKMVGRRV